MLSDALARTFIGLLLSLVGAGMALAAELAPIDQVQIHACRATSSLLLYRGEGFQETHKTRFDADIKALEAAFQSVPQPSDGFRQKYRALVTQLQQGVSYGHNEDDVPWRFPQELAKSLRELLIAARSTPGNTADGELPAKVEYLAVQYLSRAYIGTFEIARESNDTYIGQDERTLLPAIDAQLQPMDKNDPAVGKLKTRWSFLKTALSDMNSQSNTLVSASGRPYAPMMVDRHARSMSAQLLTKGG